MRTTAQCTAYVYWHESAHVYFKYEIIFVVIMCVILPCVCMYIRTYIYVLCIHVRTNLTLHQENRELIVVCLSRAYNDCFIRLISGYVKLSLSVDLRLPYSGKFSRGNIS